MVRQMRDCRVSASCAVVLISFCLISDPCSFSSYVGWKAPTEGSWLVKGRAIQSRLMGTRICARAKPPEPSEQRARRTQILQCSSGALALMGWAGWLGQNGQESSVAREVVVRLGLGAERIEDATNWELSFFRATLEAVASQAARTERVLYHYTDLDSAAAIVKGRQGLKLSRGGYRGGGVFFSKLSPLDGLQGLDGLKEGAASAQLWREVFPAFRDAQLPRNYGSDFPGREHQADAVLVCFAAESMLEDIPYRQSSCFISLEKFQTFDAEFFAYRNIPRVYRLSP